MACLYTLQGSILPYGEENRLAFFNIYIYGAFLLLFRSDVSALFLTYVVHLGTKSLRERLGSSNLSRKSLIDERFLR